MKYYITLFSCLGLGVAGFLYSQKKSEIQAVDHGELDHAREEIAQLTSKLTAIKTESAKVDVMLKKKSDQREIEKKRNECLVNQRNIQVAVRAYQNMNALSEGTPINLKAVVGAEGLLKTLPECPDGGPYTLMTTLPKVGQLAATCKHTDKAGKHVPERTGDW
jgi:hypothetical protein